MSRNQATQNASGISATGPAIVTGNIVTTSLTGFVLDQGVAFTGNATSPDDYWGAPTGPGPAPAAPISDLNGAVTTATSFATKPFAVKAPFKP